ncbi:MAG: DUF1015 domain-containing protein [Candidatus Brocadiia bacterium]|nr:DUF1015 domain-containing protein [Candidatus Brocadiia bacterium]
MPQIAAFKGLRFNPDRIPSLADVLAPPYDIVDSVREAELLAHDTHNAIRLTLGKTPPEGRPLADFARAAKHLQEWRDDAVLVQDEEHSIYVVEQTFQLRGRERCRVAFMSALLLEEFGPGLVRPHERTMSAPRADRLSLYEACHANLSPILTVCADPCGEAEALVDGVRQGEPVSAFEFEGIGHRMWRIVDVATIARLGEAVREQPLFIADGHHRYESALRYRQRHRSGTGEPGSAPEDYVLTLCVSLANPGLVVLPTHRGLKDGSELREEGLLGPLTEYFSARKLTVDDPHGAEALFEASCADDSSTGCYLPGGRLYVLEPKAASALAALRPRFPDDADVWCYTPVSLLHYVILPDTCAIQPGSSDEAMQIEFRRDAGGLCEGVEAGDFRAAFLLPPTDPRTVEKVAARGQRMPMKSTYFFPKISSGLAFYAHEGGANGPRLASRTAR